MNNIKYKLKKEAKIMLSKYNNKRYSEILYEGAFHKKIDWKNPTDFNEKLMYLKVFNYNNNPTVWACADKYQVRLYALNHGIKEKHLPELIGVYDNAKEIKEEKLPDKFVIKCTHGYGFNIICTDKKEFDIKKARRKLNKWQKTKFGYETGEVHYTHVKPKIIIEKFIEGNNGYPFDYKLYCFYGKPMLVLVCSEREEKLKLNFYDLKWNELMIGKEEYRNHKEIKAPRYLKDMIGIAKRVSKEFPFVRIDFYESNGKAIMGEMTFTPAACMASYYNETGNKYLSNLLDLSVIK